MTHSRPAVERLPTLTEVVEYDGDLIRLRSLSQTEAQAHDGEQSAAAVDGAPVASGGADAGHLPADATAAISGSEAALVDQERRIVEALDQRLAVAFAAIFERAAETTRRECQALVLEAVRDLRRQAQRGSAIDGPTDKSLDAS